MKWTTSKIWAYLFPFIASIITTVAVIMDHAAGEAIAMFGSVVLFAGGVLVSKHRHQEKTDEKSQ